MKLTESAALVQFVAEIFPESGLVPADPVLRARARASIMWVDLNFFNAYSAFFIKGQSASVLLDAIGTLQNLLPPEGFAIGQWSIADAALAPFMPRIQLFLANDIGIYPIGEGPKTLKALQEPRFTRFRKYAADVGERPSVKNTFDAVSNFQSVGECETTQYLSDKDTCRGENDFVPCAGWQVSSRSCAEPVSLRTNLLKM